MVGVVVETAVVEAVAVASKECRGPRGTDRHMVRLLRLLVGGSWWMPLAGL